MKLLIAVMSCWGDRERKCHEAIRETWAKDSPIDVRLFVGAGRSFALLHDEAQVNAADDYAHVTEKSREIFKWALARDYTHVLHCGRDTYVDVRRLLEAGFERYDYAGNCSLPGGHARFSLIDRPDPHGYFSYASGGAGSWLSRRAMEEIVRSPLYHKADDLLYGWVLGLAGIPCWHDVRFQKYGSYLYYKNVTVHLSRGTGQYAPQWMYRCHELRRMS